MRAKSLKKNKRIITTLCLLIVIVLVLFVLDFFNIPSKWGLNPSVINMDFWSMFLSNGVVISLFIITFVLFDRKKLAKEKLAEYAGIVLLRDTYKRCESFMLILKETLKTNDEDKKTEKFSDNQLRFIADEPFKDNDKIFEYLGNGYISRKRYENYKEIKQSYETIINIKTINISVPELEKKLFDKLEIDLNNEQKDLKSILENLEQKI